MVTAPSAASAQQIQASDHAFAAILRDGSVVTWGDFRSGGFNFAVRDQLKHVQQIQASKAAFAAILDNGSVVTWGEPEFGGDSSAVQDRLKNVCSRFKPPSTLLQPFLAMDLS